MAMKLKEYMANNEMERQTGNGGTGGRTGGPAGTYSFQGIR